MVRIFFASNRNVKHESSKSGNLFGDRFNEDGPQIFRVGRAEVKLKGSDPRDDDAWSVGESALYPESLDNKAAGGTHFKLGSAAMFEDLRAELKRENKDVIVYLHGFANSFQNSLQRAAALQALYATPEQDLIVVMFSWPSNGTVQPAWNYFSDREDAEASGIAMGRALKRLGEFLEALREADRKVILAAQQEGHVPDPPTSSNASGGCTCSRIRWATGRCATRCASSSSSTTVARRASSTGPS
jgi:esterase/lipase superfamily enzyme